MSLRDSKSESWAEEREKKNVTFRTNGCATFFDAIAARKVATTFEL
jgi:hypothetical protein